jgi:hypothetical protein
VNAIGLLLNVKPDWAGSAAETAKTKEWFLINRPNIGLSATAVAGMGAGLSMNWAH